MLNELSEFYVQQCALLSAYEEEPDLAITWVVGYLQGALCNSNIYVNLGIFINVTTKSTNLPKHVQEFE